METITRRSVLRGSAALAASGALARPYIANAAATTASVWWTQGFIQSEDIAFQNLAAAYQKASGNKLDYSIVPFAPLRQKLKCHLRLCKAHVLEPARDFFRYL